MAGGKGKRLRDVISDIPKPLVPISGRPLLDYIIDHLKRNGCDNIIICTGYLSDKIKEHVKKSDYGVPVRLSKEDKPLGTAGALHQVKNFLDEDFLVLFGDIFTTMDIAKLLRFHLGNRADCTLVVRKTEHPLDSNLVTINKNWTVKKLYFKPHKIIPSSYGLAAIYVLNPKVLKLLPKRTPFDLEKDFLPLLLRQEKKLVCYNTDEFIQDIGTPERYKKILQLFKI